MQSVSHRIGIKARTMLLTTECSFSQMKPIKNSNRTTMRRERLESLSLLMIEADLLRQINFEDLISLG
jgi:DNA (cytosine-5)-methyltransferase 1